MGDIGDCGTGDVPNREIECREMPSVSSSGASPNWSVSSSSSSTTIFVRSSMLE
jgi:hypothetical protein